MPQKKKQKKAVTAKKAKKQHTGQKPEFKAVDLSFNRKELESVLSIAADFTERRATMPVLTHVFMKTEGDTVRITATDLEKSWTAAIPFRGGDVSRCIPLDLLLREVRALQNEITEVDLHFTEKSVTVCRRCEIFTIPGDEFPKFPELEDLKEFTVPGILTKIKQVLPAAGDSDTRYMLNSVYIDFKGGHMVATDGHRLHFVQFPGTEEDVKINIPRQSVAVALKHGASDTVRVSGHNAVFSLSIGVMLTRLLEGNYPDYEKVIPKENSGKVSFSAPEFLKVLEGALPVVASRANAIRISINGRIDVTTANPDLGEYNWHVPCVSEGIEANYTIGFNARYLMDAIKSFTTKESDAVVMELAEPLAPCLINHGAVVMPMRI